MFTVIDEEIARFKASPGGKGFWGLRMIWTSLRIWDRKAVVQSMDHALATKLEFPHLLAGYDLVGQEDLGRPLGDLLPELFWFRKQLADEGMPDGMPFFFHAGETLGDGTSTDENLFDAVLLGTRRIGHGFSLYKHPLLVDLVKEKRILIESCPISNEVLRLCGSIMSHPLPALIARGVPCSLNNDDPAMLGQVGYLFFFHPPPPGPAILFSLTRYLVLYVGYGRDEPRFLAGPPGLGKPRPRRPGQPG